VPLRNYSLTHSLYWYWEWFFVQTSQSCKHICRQLFDMYVLRADSEGWKEFITKPSLPYALRLLAGLCSGHEPTQVFLYLFFLFGFHWIFHVIYCCAIYLPYVSASQAWQGVWTAYLRCFYFWFVWTMCSHAYLCHYYAEFWVPRAA